MITLENIAKQYSLADENVVKAVRNVSLDIDRGEFVVVIGRSGSGKTTLLNLMAGLTRPTSGRVLLDGTDLWSLSDKEQSQLRSRKFGFVFQFPSLLPTLNVLENVALPVIFKGDPGVGGAADQRADELLQLVGLEEKRLAHPRQLSAGQQQRVVIARALMNRPEILLADEPTSDLDERTEHEIVELFLKLHRQTGLTIVMVTHASQLTTYGMRSIEMVMGGIIQ
jgi:putative ABC transport system ATP-binding protein/lipoprotein-releasing system ATP-binding protein